MINTLTQEQTKTLQEIMVLAEQRKAQKQSKQIEKSGGECLNIVTTNK